MKKRVKMICTMLYLFTLFPLITIADTKDKVTGDFIPANLPDPAISRSINIVQVKGGSSNLDSESLVDGTNASALNDWVVDTTRSATFSVQKLIMDSGETEPSLTVANYTLSSAYTVTTSGGEAMIDLGTPSAHNPNIPADFYTDHFDGTNEASGPESAASPDGFYLVDETSDVTGHKKYRGIISVPYMVEDKTGTTNDANMVYGVHIYPKYIPSLGFGFHSYVNIIYDGVPNARFASRSTTPGEFDYSHWTSDSVFNGSKNNWTIGIDLSHEVLDQCNGDTGGSPSYRFGLGLSSGYGDIAVGEKASCLHYLNNSTPANYDSTINTSRQTASGIGVIFTKLSTGERTYVDFKNGPGKWTSFTHGGKTLNFTSIADNLHSFNDSASPANMSGIIVRSDNIQNLKNIFGVNNAFGGDFAGKDLLDPTNGYAVMLTYTNHAITQGLHFTPEYLSSDLTTPLHPVTTMEYGFYALSGGSTPAHNGKWLTTFGLDDSGQNGFTNGDVKGQADGYGEFGVLRERAQVTTGGLNVIKLSEENEPLGNAKFVIKIMKNADGVTGFPGQEGCITDSALTPDQYIVISTSTGVVGTTTAIGSATTFTSDSATATLGKLQALGLDADVDYQLIETAAPNGYQMLKQPLNIPKTNVSETTYVVDQTDDDLIKVINLPTVLLPVTGGQSLWIVLIIGVMAVTIGLVLKKRSIKGEKGGREHV
jgi:hypothetical protein